jgi:signal transduction histidine kinase/DNA-binding response OmpR family regulator
LKQALPYLQNAGAIGFTLLGLVTAVSWARRRDPSTGFLALAIVLLSSVALLASVPASASPPFLGVITLVLFMGSGYALLRFRASLIPLSPRWHAVAVIAIVVATAAVIVTQRLINTSAAPTTIYVLVVIAFFVTWSATVIEPTIRFLLVARDLPAVQAWRLRSLSFGFGGLVAVLAFAIASLAFATQPVVQVLIQLGVVAIVPLLYVSFTPPAWLRRQWRSSEEEGLRAFMQDTLLQGEDPSTLADRALEWALRLVGGAAAVAFDGDGAKWASRALSRPQLNDLERQLRHFANGVSRSVIDGVERTVFVIPIAGAGADGHLVVLAGPFTPSFGHEELNRVQQFMSAVTAGVDRASLLEKVSAANAELTEANHHKTVFLANMSHELRTPLNAILGFSELLIDAPDGQFPNTTKIRFLEQIHSSGKHLLGLINDILDLAKIEAGQMELHLQAVAVADVLGQVAATVEPLLAKKHMTLETEAASAGQITADEGKLKQMVLNLVSNAIKFTAEGGAISIKAIRAGSRLQIVVADNGIGIADADIKRIFHEFQQVDSGANRKQQGTGLGLTLTRSFAALHGGDVRLESELGKGSRFTIDLPVNGPEPHAGEMITTVSTSEAELDSSRPLILVVEDDPASAELLARQVERAGFRTQNARNGTQAMAMAKAQRPVAITLDIMLPDIDGWEVLTRLKRDESTSDIPVIVVSVVDDPALGTALGALDYFVKPVEAKALVSRLSNFNFSRRSKGRQTRVLVVDDEVANRDWLKNVLEPAGFGVTIATGGREAIKLAKSGKPDLIMLDLLMPGINGFDVVEALSGSQATRAIPIMVLTAKNLTAADIAQLNGRVSTILRRGSTGSMDLLAQLQLVLNQRAVVA